MEERSTKIIREARIKYEKLAVLWAMGKESTASLWLARKADSESTHFTVVHLDNGLEFPESYAFRNQLAREWGLDLRVVRTGVKRRIADLDCCVKDKTEGLRTLRGSGIDAVIFSGGLSDHGTKEKERAAMPEGGEGLWSEAIWARSTENYTSRVAFNGITGIHPLLGWNEIDIWLYTKQEGIPVNPLYFSKIGYRYTSLGCTHCSTPLKSSASSIDEIISELRETRGEKDADANRSKNKASLKERLKVLGYA